MGSGLSFEVRQRLDQGSVVVMYRPMTPPEQLWKLNEAPPWVWSPVLVPPGLYMAVVLEKRGENIKVHRLREDPDAEGILETDSEYQPISCSAKMIWDVRAKVSGLPPSSTGAPRWMLQGASL